jgi:hypothetical protein
MFWEVGVIKLTANRRQFSPISLKRGNKQSKTDFPRHGTAMFWEVGVIKPASVLANKPQER